MLEHIIISYVKFYDPYPRNQHCTAYENVAKLIHGLARFRCTAFDYGLYPDRLPIEFYGREYCWSNLVVFADSRGN